MVGASGMDEAPASDPGAEPEPDWMGRKEDTPLQASIVAVSIVSPNHQNERKRNQTMALLQYRDGFLPS